jgi:hypothetical protein
MFVLVSGRTGTPQHWLLMMDVVSRKMDKEMKKFVLRKYIHERVVEDEGY